MHVTSSNAAAADLKLLQLCSHCSVLAVLGFQLCLKGTHTVLLLLNDILQIRARSKQM